MICQHCGSEIRDDSNFCTYCGMAMMQQYAVPHYVGPRRLDPVKLLGDTFTLYLRHFVMLCLIGLIVMGITAVIQMGQVTLTANAEPFIGLVSAASLGFLNFLFQSYMAIVAIRQCFHIARGGTGFQKGLLFPPVFMVLNMIGLSLLIAGATFLLCVPIIVMGTIAGMAFGQWTWGIGLVVMGFVMIVMGLSTVWLNTRLWLSSYFLVDQNTGCIDALVQAWRVSSGNDLALFCVIFVLLCPVFFWSLTCYGVAFVVEGNFAMMETIHGILLLTAGLIPVVLLGWLGSSLAYLQLTGQLYRLEMEEKFEFV